jgi:cytochrome c oxidase cbb3-type subunit 1
MWLAVNEDGTLTNSFVQSLEATWPFYVGRLIGGTVFFSGMLVMAYNTIRTVRAQSVEEGGR